MKLHYRSKSNDREIYNSVFTCNEYEIGHFSQSDIVIDVGAHIGSFSLLAATRGAGRVVAFEPNLDSFKLLHANTTYLRQTIEVHPLAVCRSDGDQLQQHGYEGWVDKEEIIKNTGGGWLAAKGSKLCVSALALDTILADLGQVRLLKLDCEGAEWSILYNSKRLGQVGAIVGEFHIWPAPYRKEGDPAHTIETLKLFLETQGYEIVFCNHSADNPWLGKFWAKRAV